MSKNRKLFIAKIALILGAVPLALQAYSEGPPARRAGAPGDAGTCLGSGCHSGAALNGGPGNVKIILPNGNTYSPGVKQHILVQITDSSKAKFGFEFTARLATNLANGQAGTLSSTDQRTQVICEDDSLAPCSSQFPVQFVEHTGLGYTASTAGGFTYAFDWTPPATNAGNVTLYAAANAGPAGGPVQTSADIYTTNVTLTPSVTPPSGPTPDPGGIVPVYSSSTTVSSGTWVSIYSTIAKNLAPATVLWNGDFPTQLGGVSVLFGDKPAYLWFVSASQINLQVPDNIGTGTVPVTIKNASGQSIVNVTVGQTSPSFLLIDANHPAGYVYSSTGVQTLLGPTGAPGGARPAKKGEAVAIYAVGFGPTNPAVPAGPFTAGGTLAAKPTITVGGVAVNVDFAGIVGAGLYQFNFVVPSNIGSGDQIVIATAGGLSSQASVAIPVQ